MYTSPTQVPGTYQSRPDSAPNKSYNCGPASATHTARFYKDRNFGINDTRRLALLQNYVGATPSQIAAMLSRRGVPCKADRVSTSQLISLVRARPVCVRMLMSKVPSPYRRYSFTGYHELTAVAVRAGDTPSMAFMDPNYGWPDGKTGDPPKYIWMPYSIWKAAFQAASSWVVYPDKAKPNPTRIPYAKSCTVTAPVNVRTGPGTTYTRLITLPKGAKLKSTQLEKSGGRYTDGSGIIQNDWLSYVRDGRVVWVARSFVKEG